MFSCLPRKYLLSWLRPALWWNIWRINKKTLPLLINSFQWITSSLLTSEPSSSLSSQDSLIWSGVAAGKGAGRHIGHKLRVGGGPGRSASPLCSLLNDVDDHYGGPGRSAALSFGSWCRWTWQVHHDTEKSSMLNIMVIMMMVMQIMMMDW